MIPLVSVAMATYNGSQFISQQIESVLSQSFTKIELIIVDDCSSDETFEYLKTVQLSDQRVKLFRNKVNLGCSRSFERAISLCSGEFIALCDQDDIWNENKIATLINEIGDNDLIYSDCTLIDALGISSNKSYSQLNSLFGIDSCSSEFKKISLFNSFILGCSILFKAHWKDKILPLMFDRFNHDKWIVNIISQNNGKIKFIPISLFCYRIHGNNLSFSKKESIYKKLMNKKAKPVFYFGDNLSELLKRVSCENNELIYLDETLAGHKVLSVKDRLLVTYKFYNFMYMPNSFLSKLKSVFYFIFFG